MAPSGRVEITRQGAWFVICDEHGEFARASTVGQAIRYAGDLLEGPSTEARAPLGRERIREAAS